MRYGSPMGRDHGLHAEAVVHRLVLAAEADDSNAYDEALKAVIEYDFADAIFQYVRAVEASLENQNFEDVQMGDWTADVLSRGLFAAEVISELVQSLVFVLDDFGKPDWTAETEDRLVAVLDEMDADEVARRAESFLEHPDE
jgi:hypothetical protein